MFKRMSKVIASIIVTLVMATCTYMIALADYYDEYQPTYEFDDFYVIPAEILRDGAYGFFVFSAMPLEYRDVVLTTSFTAQPPRRPQFVTDRAWEWFLRNFIPAAWEIEDFAFLPVFRAGTIVAYIPPIEAFMYFTYMPELARLEARQRAFHTELFSGAPMFIVLADGYEITLSNEMAEAGFIQIFGTSLGHGFLNTEHGPFGFSQSSELSSWRGSWMISLLVEAEELPEGLN